MGTDVVRQITGEDREFHRKNRELTELEALLAQRELELATLKGELLSFQARYLSIVGLRYRELDELNAQIAEAQFRLRPDDLEMRRRAEQARFQANESAKNTQNNQEENKLKKIKTFKPSEGLKKLYREIAKRIHPDLASNEEEREHFQHLMAKANKAYQEEDETGLRNILHLWKKGGQAENNNNKNKLAWLAQRIKQIQDRLTVIELEKEQIRQSSLYQLKMKVEAAAGNGLDLISEMAKVLDQQISFARTKLGQINRKGMKDIAS